MRWYDNNARDKRWILKLEKKWVVWHLKWFPIFISKCRQDLSDNELCNSLFTSIFAMYGFFTSYLYISMLLTPTFFCTLYWYCIGTVLYCIVLYCIVLYCIVLCCIVLYCIVLYCIVVLFVVIETPIPLHKRHVCRILMSNLGFLDPEGILSI